MTTVHAPTGAVLNTTWQNAPTHTINAGGVEFAYRELGPRTGVPVVFLTHLAAVLDNWDPRVVDGIAAKHRVITFDNRGVGASSGATPRTIEEMARDAVTFIRALGFDQVDLFGFSMGGMIAQVIAQQQPQLVRKMIIAGTGPAGGEGIDKVTRITYLDTARGLLTRQDPKQFLFFTRTPNGRRAGKEFLARLAERTNDRDKAISVRSFRAQLKAIHRWGQQTPADLGSIHQPVLVMNGDSDKMVPTQNTDRPPPTTPQQPTRHLSRRRARRRVPVPRRTSSSGLWSSSEMGTVMKAFVVEQYGKDGLRAADVPEPEVGDGDVLVKVSAASVNPLDMMVRNGEFKQLLKYRTPFVLGHDVAGVVTRVGSFVRDFEVGDEVYARPRDLRIGTFAEYIAIDQDDVAPKPDSLTLHEAAAVPLVSLAAWQALVDRAHLKPGQKVLVHAGSGGLGSTVIQLAKHLGATVATTASGKNAELVRSLGADVVVDYKKEDFADVLSGYDVVLDSLGGENLEKSLTVLKPGGQAISVTGPPDPGFAKQLGAPQYMGVVMGLLSRKVHKQARKLGVSYSFLFMQANGAQLRELAALYDAGHLRPVIDKTFPFDQTLQALAYAEQGRANGKVVITLD